MLPNMLFHKYFYSVHLCSRGTDAYQFPPFLNKRKDEDLWIFTTDLCRSMKLKFNKEDDIDGIDIYRYIVPTGILKVALLIYLLEMLIFYIYVYIADIFNIYNFRFWKYQ